MFIYTIYKVTNILNNKCYIGFDSAWPKRMKDHLKDYSKEKDQKILYRAMRKHGVENFSFEVIYQSREPGNKMKSHTLTVMEPYFIKEYDSLIHGYNATSGGEGTPGRVVADTTKKLMSDNMVNRISCKDPITGETFKVYKDDPRWINGELVGITKGRVPSKEHTAKASAALLGRVFSDEHKQKLSKANKGKPSQLKGRANGPYIGYVCPHCSKTGGRIMKRWHFDNCKLQKV